MKKSILILVSLLAIGCSENEMAKKYGGTAKLELSPNQKLVNITWKENSMWILTRPMRKDEAPEIFEFQERSKYGLLEGKIIVSEQK